MNLRIFDCSNYISVGAAVSSDTLVRGVVEEAGEEYAPRIMPCGGIGYLLKTIDKFRNRATELIFCFDRPPTKKRELYKETFKESRGYKGQRPAKASSIVLQREMAEEILNQIGVATTAVEGYEADDCIASIVKHYSKDYENVYIHSLDSDMRYLINEKVSVVPLIKKGKIFNRDNYEETVGKGTEFMPYNTITLDKLFKGEPGDGIPRITAVMVNKIRNFIPPGSFPMCGSNDLLKRWIAKATDNDPIVMGTLQLIQPYILSEGKLAIESKEFDNEVYEYYAMAMGSRKHRDCVYSSCAEQTIERYVERFMSETERR